MSALFRSLLTAIAALCALCAASSAWAQATTTYTAFAGPSGLVFDSAGVLYISNDGGVIRRIGAGGAPITTFGTVPGGFRSSGLAFAANGDLFASSETGASIYRFAAGCTQPCTPTLFANTVFFPEEIVFDTAGNLYLGNIFNTTIYRFAAGCTEPCTATILATGGFINDTPFGLAIDPANNLFALLSNGRIVRIAAGCSAPCTATLVGTIGIPNARGLIIDGAGDLYSVSLSSATAYRTTQAGVTTAFGSGMAGAFGLALGRDSAIYAGDRGNNRVARIGGVVNALPPGPAPVPTLSEWALILLGLTLAGSAAVVLNQRRAAF